MIITPIKTKIVTAEDKLFDLLDQCICHPEFISGSSHKDKKMPKQVRHDRICLEESSVLAVTSKIISVCEGRMVPVGSVSKDELIKKESQYYLPRGKSKYQVSFSITHNMLAASAGVDESNGNGDYILWPKDVQQSANMIREHLATKFGLKKIGVIITDSRAAPLRWGVTGIALAHSGFLAIKDYVGQSDLFGRQFAYEKLNIADSLAAAAALVMGEGSEQTPLAVIADIPDIEFRPANPTKKELESLVIAKEDDLYGPLLNSVKWEKGEKDNF